MVIDALRDAWALLMPIECAGCHEPDRALCAECALALSPTVTVRTGTSGLRVHSGLRYEAIPRRVLLAFKESGRTDVAAALSASLSASIVAAVAAVAAAGSGAPIELLPIPTSRHAYRRRGYDPVVLLVRTGGLRAERELTRGRSTGIQKSLGLDERAANLKGAFVARRPLTGRRFILVDDILTSGATLAEAARAVEAAGGAVCGAATVAYTPRILPIRDIASAEDYGG